MVVLSLFVLVGCATYQTKVDEPRRIMLSEPDRSVQMLRPLAEAEGRDQLIYVLDYATALQAAGRFDESAKEFIRAEKIADSKDYHSVTQVAGSLLLSEEMVQYKGENFEKLFINAMNALNFLNLGQLDSALVEARRLNQKVVALRAEGKTEFSESPFGFYLSAVLWEADRKVDDAYIAYSNAYKADPSIRLLREDLIRSALRAGRGDELKKWKGQFPEVELRPEWRDRKASELVVVAQTGWGPQKRPRPEAPRFPYLVRVPSRTQAVVLKVWPSETRRPSAEKSESDQAESAQTQAIDAIPLLSVRSERIQSVTDVAIRTLEADYARLVASRVAGVATKAVVADQIRQKDELLGGLAWIAMNLADRADLRQWSTLPSEFHIARVWLKPGTYRVTVHSLLNSGEESEALQSTELVLQPGRKSFLTARTD